MVVSETQGNCEKIELLYKNLKSTVNIIILMNEISLMKTIMYYVYKYT